MNVLTTLPKLDQTQDLAFLFETSGAPGAFEVLAFSANEAINQLFQVDLELVSDKPDIDLHALIDAPATLTVLNKYDEPRLISGVIAAASRGEEGVRRTVYSVMVLPALHRLAYGSDCRIFQEMSVPDIVKQVLQEQGIDDVKWTLAGEHVAREYCVQYRESHLAFIERLTAEEGIFFFFHHGKEGQHTLHFIDYPEGCPALEPQKELEYNAMPGGVVKGIYCSRFSFHEQVRSTSYTQREYTFKNPDYNQEHRHERAEDNGSNTNYALYDYPGRYKKDVAGKPFTQARLEAVRVDASTGSGETNAIHLCAGHLFSLTEHPLDKYNIKYRLLSVSHAGSQPQAMGEEAGDGAAHYSAGFTVMPARLPYRPPLKSHPMVDGPQIAHVTGPAGEEIYCDEYGRVKISFPWRRDCPKNEKSSCWVRVSQNWAGALWGHMAIPRIGQEVIVEFLEGDPDQPIITGRTYDAPHLTPYKLPDNKTRMTIKSKTHKGDGFNELRFEDEKGQEEVYMHAEKDRNEKVKNNHTERIDNNWVQSVGHNKAIEVTNNHDEVIGGNMTLSVGPSSIGQIVNSTVSKLTEGISSIGSALGLPGLLNPGEGNQTITIEKNKGETVGIASMEAVGVSKMSSVGKTYHINVGTKMVITVGKSQVSLDKSGYIKITGTRFNFSSSGPVQINGKDVDIN